MRRAVLFPSPILILVPLAALLLVLPLIVQGCSCGHDFDFHLVSWFEAAAQLQHGTLHPHWAWSPGWNAGEPRFVFYPPISWMLGALLGMILPWAAVPIVYTWLALTAAGFGMVVLARRFAGSPVALLAAMIYMANPYMMFTAYERTAYAELLAAAWIPLLLAAALRTRPRVPGIALPVALLWLTNAPAAVMGCYALAVVAAIRVLFAWRSRDGETWKLAGTFAAGVALGLGLAAFYVVPAAYERRWVEIAMATLSGMRIEDNFLFHRTADAAHDEVLRTASWIAVGLVSVATVLLAWGLWKRKLFAPSRNASPTPGLQETFAKHNNPALWVPLVPLAVLAVAITVLLTPVSAVVWRVMPEMAFLQFPWRLLAVLAAIVCAGLTLPLSRLKPHGTALVTLGFLLAGVLGWPALYLFRQACDEEDTVSARLAVFNARTGTDPTDEYTLKGADNDVLGHADPPYWLGPNADAAPPARASQGPLKQWFTVNSTRPQWLVVDLRAYPAWRLWVNGVQVPIHTDRADGLLDLAVPEGQVAVGITWRRTPDQTLGLAISGASVAIFALALGWGRRRLQSSIIES